MIPCSNFQKHFPRRKSAQFRCHLFEISHEYTWNRWCWETFHFHPEHNQIFSRWRTIHKKPCSCPQTRLLHRFSLRQTQISKQLHRIFPLLTKTSFLVLSNEMNCSPSLLCDIRTVSSLSSCSTQFTQAFLHSVIFTKRRINTICVHVQSGNALERLSKLVNEENCCFFKELFSADQRAAAERS